MNGIQIILPQLLTVISLIMVVVAIIIQTKPSKPVALNPKVIITPPSSGKSEKMQEKLSEKTTKIIKNQQQQQPIIINDDELFNSQFNFINHNDSKILNRNNAKLTINERYYQLETPEIKRRIQLKPQKSLTVRTRSLFDDVDKQHYQPESLKKVKSQQIEDLVSPNFYQSLDKLEKFHLERNSIQREKPKEFLPASEQCKNFYKDELRLKIEEHRNLENEVQMIEEEEEQQEVELLENLQCDELEQEKHVNQPISPVMATVVEDQVKHPVELKKDPEPLFQGFMGSQLLQSNPTNFQWSSAFKVDDKPPAITINAPTITVNAPTMVKDTPQINEVAKSIFNRDNKFTNPSISQDVGLSEMKKNGLFSEFFKPKEVQQNVEVQDTTPKQPTQSLFNIKPVTDSLIQQSTPSLFQSDKGSLFGNLFNKQQDGDASKNIPTLFDMSRVVAVEDKTAPKQQGLFGNMGGSQYSGLLQNNVQPTQGLFQGVNQSNSNLFKNMAPLGLFTLPDDKVTQPITNNQK